MSAYNRFGSIEDDQIEFVSLTSETLEGALEVIRKSFFVYESVSIGVDLKSEPGASEELEELCLNAAKDGISIVAVDLTTHQVIGVAFNKIQVRNSSEKSYFEYFSENCKYKSSKALVDFMINVDARLDLFRFYNVNCIFEIMFLATLPTYGKRTIGEMLVASSLELCRLLNDEGDIMKTAVTIHGKREVTNLNNIPHLVSAIMTSKYSQRIAVKNRFQNHIEVSYDEFEFNGKKFSERIGKEHKKCILVAKRPVSLLNLRKPVKLVRPMKPKMVT